jgi:SPP1 family predicted phage head-tail adaptor
MSCDGFPSSCELRTLVNIQRATPSEDALGGRLKSWTTIESPYAKWEDGGGSEGSYAGGRRSTVGHTITIRKTDVKASDRIELNGVAYNITYIGDIKQRGVWLKIGLTEGVPP